MLRPIALSVVVAWLWPVVAIAQEAPPTMRIEAVEHQVVTATIGYEIRTTKFTVTRWMAFLPEPPELPSQTRVKVTADPVGKLVTEKSPLGRKVRLIDVPVGKAVPGGKLAMRLDVQATLLRRDLVPLLPGEKPPIVAPLTAVEKKFYLAPSGPVDFDTKTFQKWLDATNLRRRKDESTLSLAARVLEVIRANFTYKFDQAEDKRASTVCTRTGTDCGGMTFLFIAAMRANQTPARILVGRIAAPREAGSAPGDLGFDRPHVRAEFYMPGVGWVSVDANNANVGKNHPVEAFIGHDPGDLLVLHVDADLVLPFPDMERTTDLIQIAPYYWLNGRGPFDAMLSPSIWEVKTTPAAPR